MNDTKHTLLVWNDEAAVPAFFLIPDGAIPAKAKKVVLAAEGQVINSTEDISKAVMVSEMMSEDEAGDSSEAAADPEWNKKWKGILNEFRLSDEKRIKMRSVIVSKIVCTGVAA